MDYIIEVLLYLLQGSKTTLLVFSMTLLSIPLGLLLAVIRKLNIGIVNRLLDGYTWIIRGTPLLLQLFFVVYGLPILFGSIFLIDEIYGAIFTFIINYTAYFVEIFRGGMNAIPKSQYDASKALSLSPYQMFRHVILPQTIHKTLPSIANEMITLVKDTALVSAVAISDILRNTRETVSQDFRVEAYFVAALLYLVMTYVIVYIFKRIENRRLVAYGVN
ncbi:amino acid ABC transporter permease [Paracholeplasma manati]|uniref:Amino acid ABC transporter permease n=1 Tax=Paracholeplasma manati TaxID=591373 RepID=A0ABT2Y6G9_9MOLU|nr:amino acid ABC transporter permease [Paracholeplasma manati]MCV2232336.1 amino acid ABC transporter permease [Paracholeplasma manati]MDG0888293.1 amino acid ABC transporter permease [Paracholeplasma manati]